jgi:hypothetical protein
MNIEEQIKREKGVHGEQWGSLHGGYFSDTFIVRPFIKTIASYLSAFPADMIIDLGGGTGFVLRELMAEGVTGNMISVNLDASETQMEAIEKNVISCIKGMISDFSRGDLTVDGEKRIFFIMRSVLHYFGKDGLAAVLQHIRDQAKQGEMFIHQSVCFETAGEARCMNALYREMGSPKWYPVVQYMRDCATAAGWETMALYPAPSLKLSSAELGQRYGLDQPALLKIRDRLMNEFGEIENVFERVSDGFTAYLHYRIVVARAS